MAKKNERKGIFSNIYSGKQEFETNDQFARCRPFKDFIYLLFQFRLLLRSVGVGKINFKREYRSDLTVDSIFLEEKASFLVYKVQADSPVISLIFFC